LWTGVIGVDAVHPTYINQLSRGVLNSATSRPETNPVG
jgi:hypothetical protein